MTKVLVLFGGPSSEHEVSLMSAASVLKNMDKEIFEIIPVGITPEGVFQLYERQFDIQKEKWEGFEEARFEYEEYRKNIQLIPGESVLIACDNHSWEKIQVDMALPILHGPYGEDGTLQGLLQACNIPYAGAGVMTSALAMDKAFTKKLLENEKIDQAPYRVVDLIRSGTINDSLINELERDLNFPMFVKPARMGSSVGISKASHPKELEEALKKALVHDSKVVVEAFVEGREIECAVLGHYQDPIVAAPAEIIPSREFYDYEDKYLAGKSHYKIPAELSEQDTEKAKELSIRVYQLLECKGLARVDFFLDRKTGQLLVNEINTMPGFTKISMYPKMWEASGLSYKKLITCLIEEAIEDKLAYCSVDGEG